MPNSLARMLSIVSLLGCTACNTTAPIAGTDTGPSPRDAGRDAGSADSGPAPDAAPSPDAAMDDDAATTDGGESDAGAPEVDADVVDADLVDAAELDAGPTPPVTPSAPGDIVITEIQAAPAGYADDSLAEWVEFHNPSTTVTYDLNGCIFADKPADNDYTISSELLIAPGGYIVLSSAAFTMATQGFVSDGVYGTTGTGLSGTGDAPTLKCSGAIIDTADYEVGFPVPDTMEGHTVSLDPGSLDAVANDDGANWCFSTTVFHTSLAMDNTGTPGEANEACP